MNSTFETAIMFIIILMILGIIVQTNENTTDKIVKTQEIDNIEKLLSETADYLINNPGEPANWNEYMKGRAGLGIQNSEGLNIPNSVSYSKLITLGKNYDKFVFKDLFDSKLKTSIELIPQQSSISSIKIGDWDDGDEVFAVNRMVKCDFYKKYVLKDFEEGGKCNHAHDQSRCSCNYFKIFKGNLLKSDYYLLIDDGEDLDYIIDTTRVVKDRYWQTPSSDVIYLNPEINFYEDTSAIVFIHLNKPNAKAVLINVPKDFDLSYLDYDYFRMNECQFILKAWY